MEIREILKNEIKRLVRVNDELEKQKMHHTEEINKNALTICEIAKIIQDNL